MTRGQAIGMLNGQISRLTPQVATARLRAVTAGTFDVSGAYCAVMTPAGSISASQTVGSQPQVTELLPVVRRFISSRVSDHAVAEDLTQETLTRVLAAAGRVTPDMLEPYAIVTARNMIASMWKEQDRHRRNQHRVVDLRTAAAPDEGLLQREERHAMARALARLSDRERHILLAHEVSGQDTQSLADEVGSTAGAVSAQLYRARARVRVEYLLVSERVEPIGDRCRPVLMALSTGDRRRQRELDAGRHLLECDVCARISEPLMGRNQRPGDEVRIRVSRDADVVLARQGARDLASRIGFPRTDLTIIATAVSEITRNIVRFADVGEIVIEALSNPRAGIRVTARDKGPGIADVEEALLDGYSTNRGLGLGLPGARRLVDDFVITSEEGRGTTVTMTKWLQEG
jgi:RNA polymerase sigma factor (sigma-70 family)